MANVQRDNVRIHSTAVVSDAAHIGAGTAIWQYTQVREGARIGRGCVIGKCVYIGAEITIGDYCKIENHASLHEGVTLEAGVFVGPHVVLTNDRLPRAINPDGSLKGPSDWVMGRVTIRYGASLGAGAVILPAVTVGRWAMVGAGAVVTKDVPDHALVVGNPARVVGYVCACGHRLVATHGEAWRCTACGEECVL